MKFTQYVDFLKVGIPPAWWWLMAALVRNFSSSSKVRLGYVPLSDCAPTARSHPEKILLLSGNFLHEQKENAVALVAALIEACQLCQTPEFREELIAILALKAFTGATPEVLRNSLRPMFNTGTEQVSAAGFHIFDGLSLNDLCHSTHIATHQRGEISAIKPRSFLRVLARVVGL